MNAKHNANAVAALEAAITAKIDNLQQQINTINAERTTVTQLRAKELAEYASLKREYLYAVLTPYKAVEPTKAVEPWPAATEALAWISRNILDQIREDARKNKTFRKRGFRKLTTTGANAPRKIVSGSFLREYSEAANYARSCQWSHTYVYDVMDFALIPSDKNQACMYRIEGMDKPEEFVGSEVEFIIMLEQKYERELLTSELLLSVRNAEVLRKVREQIGISRFLKLMQAKLIHEQTDQYGKPMRLYQCQVQVNSRFGLITRTFQVLEVTDTSTDRIYHLYPTRNCETCEDAKRSTFADHTLAYRQGDVGLVELDQEGQVIVFDQPLCES